MLEQQFQHDGRSDSPFMSQASPATYQEIREVHFEKSGKTEKEELWKAWDVQATMSPATLSRDADASHDDDGGGGMMAGSSSLSRSSSFTTPTSGKHAPQQLLRKQSSNKESCVVKPPLSDTSETYVVKTPKEKDLCAELANRLEVNQKERREIPVVWSLFEADNYCLFFNVVCYVNFDVSSVFKNLKI
jgi:hypothetical protein